MIKQVETAGIGRDGMFRGYTFGMGRDSTTGDPFLWIEMRGEGDSSMMVVVPATPAEIVEMTRLFNKKRN